MADQQVFGEEDVVGEVGHHREHEGHRDGAAGRQSIEAVGDEGRVDGFDGAAVRRSGPTTEEHTGGDGEHLFEFDQFEG